VGVLIGGFDRDELTLATVGSLRVAVIGSCPVIASERVSSDRRSDARTWWHRQVAQLTSGPPPRRTPDLDWGYPLRAPVWVTPAAVDTARAVLHATGDTAPASTDDRVQGIVVSILRRCAPPRRR
jgi:hypothetical protein